MLVSKQAWMTPMSAFRFIWGLFSFLNAPGGYLPLFISSTFLSAMEVVGQIGGKSTKVVLK